MSQVSTGRAGSDGNSMALRASYAQAVSRGLMYVGKLVTFPQDKKVHRSPPQRPSCGPWGKPLEEGGRSTWVQLS